MYSEMIEYQSTKRFGNDISYLDKLDTKELAQRNDELVRRLTGAVGELKKFKDGLDLFSPWMENAQKKLIEKEKYLTDFDKIDNCFESTTVFVSDVIEHQADLNSITNSAKNFIDQFKSYLSYSKEYRSLPPSKRARIESLSTMEDELSDMVASITSEFRELLLRVHGLLSNELSGLSVKQKKYKEAVNAAGIWLKGAERRTNEILSEPVSTDDVSVLKSQLSRTLAINAEFVSQERLIGDAKKVLGILLRSLEGQLSPDEMADVKNPIIEIENKYSCLLTSLNERCQMLDIVLVRLKKDASNDVRSKSPVSISEKNTGVAQNDTEEERRDEVERSIDGRNIKFNTESTSLESTEESSRNGFEEETIPGSETPTFVETNIESNTEAWKDDELEEGEYVSPVESPPKDLEEKIDDKSETSANESSSETSSMIHKLLKYAEDISEDSLADDKCDQEEGINTVPDVPTNEHSCVTSPSMLKEIPQVDIRDDKNGAEGENNITPETPTSVDKTAGGPVLSDTTAGGPELSDSTAGGSKLSEILQDVLESQKIVGSNTPICESMLVDFISDSECLSFEDGEEILEGDLLDKSSPRPETPGTSASESKIVAYSESSSFEELPQESNPRSATLTIEQIVETCMEYSSSKAAENCSKNTSAEVMDVFCKNNLEEESGLKPVIPTTNQNVYCTSVEVINDALVNILAEDLDCLAKQIDVLTKQIDESEKMIEVSFGAETSSIKSQLESFIIHQETQVFKKPEDIKLESEAVKIDDLLKKHLLTRQPVILLHDISKTLLKKTARRESQDSNKYNLRFPKADEHCLKTSKKDPIQKAKSLLQKKKPFKVDLKKHPVSLLQEYCCHYNLTLPRYHFEEKRSSFLVSVVVKNKKYTAKDPSKKKGKMEAAKLCLQDLRLLPKS